MPPASIADVIIATDRLPPAAMRSLRRVLDVGDRALHRLIVVTSRRDDAELESLARINPAVRLVQCANNPTGIQPWTLGLRASDRDCFLLAPGTMVAPGWLTELSAVAYSEERVAFAWPLSNLSSSHRPLESDHDSHVGIDESLANIAFSGLPRHTTAPGVHGPCVFLRRHIVDAIGLPDPFLPTLQAAIDDWVSHAQAVGFFGKRANHAYVEHVPPEANPAEPGFPSAQDRAIFENRHQHLAHQLARFDQSLDGQLPRHAIEFVHTGKLRVALDIRHLARGSQAARSDAINLAQLLAQALEIDLWCLVDDPAQAIGFPAPFITAESWRDDFAVIHKLASFDVRTELALPFGSSAHVIVSVNKWTCRGATAATGGSELAEPEGTTALLGVLCAQGILAPSPEIGDGITATLGIPQAEITLTPHVAAADIVLRAYRSAVLNPSERSLHARRMLGHAILSWSKVTGRLRVEAAHTVPNSPNVGVRQAWQGLHAAVQRRVGREIRRLRRSIH